MGKSEAEILLSWVVADNSGRGAVKENQMHRKIRAMIVFKDRLFRFNTRQ